MTNVDNYRKQLREQMSNTFGNDKDIVNKMNIIITNCESRIKRHRKCSCLSVYEKYYDIIYQMVLCDLNEDGAEGELSRSSNGISTTKAISRASDEVLSKLPQVIG